MWLEIFQNMVEPANGTERHLKKSRTVRGFNNLLNLGKNFS
jgi:hypothetical protein